MHLLQGGGWARVVFVRRALERRITLLNVALLVLCVTTLLVAIAADQACFEYSSLLYAAVCPLGESLHVVCAVCLALRHVWSVEPLIAPTLSVAHAIKQFGSIIFDLYYASKTCEYCPCTYQSLTLFCILSSVIGAQ